MRRTRVNALTALVALVVVSYAVVLRGQFLLGVVAALLFVVTSFAVRHGDREHALVLLGLVGMIAVAVVIGDLLVVVLAVSASSFVYQVWSNLRRPARRAP
jgi:hypothetical protein